MNRSVYVSIKSSRILLIFLSVAVVLSMSVCKAQVIKPSDTNNQNKVSIKKIVMKDELKYDGETILTYSIEYPQFQSQYFKKCIPEVNAFYKEMATNYKKHCEDELLKLAIDQYKMSVENDYPIRMYEALMTFEVTYSSSCAMSLFVDQYEYTGGAHGNTIRQSQTWNLKDCKLFELSQLVTCKPNYKDYILKQVEEQINKNPNIYFDNSKELIAENFNENNFYCTPKGIVVYYQQYEIAPYSSGIREFIIPYSNCIKTPQMLCCVN